MKKADGMYCVKTFYDERAFGPETNRPFHDWKTLRAIGQSRPGCAHAGFVHALSTEAQSMRRASGADVMRTGSGSGMVKPEAVELTPKCRGGA